MDTSFDYPSLAETYSNNKLIKKISTLTLLHSELPKLWSFGHSECNRVNDKLSKKYVGTCTFKTELQK